jgi:hypothetical protein
MSYPDIAEKTAEKEEWQRFVQDELVPVAESAQRLLQLRGRLAEYEGASLGEAEERETAVRSWLVGGLSPDGEYTDSSLARFTDVFLGVGLDNPREWALAQREGLSGDDAVEIEVHGTEFVSFLETVVEQVAGAVEQASMERIELSQSEQGLLRSPDAAIDEIQEVLSVSLGLTVNTHPLVFFAYTVDPLTRRYIEEAYPALGSDFEEIAEFLDLELRFQPDVADSEMRRLYTVWGHAEDGFLDRVGRVNNAVWELFGDEGLRDDLTVFFDTVPRPRTDFQRQREESLADWSYPDYVVERMEESMEESDEYIGGSGQTHPAPSPDNIPSTSAKSTDDSRYGVHLDRLVPDDGLFVKWRGRSVNTTSYSDTEIDFHKPISVFEYLDDVMPGVFMGKYNLLADEGGVKAYHV